MSRTDRDWNVWAEKDPYFGVVTDGKFRAAKIEDNRAEFMKSGDDYVANLIRVLNSHFGPLPQGRALDFGCGVGRLTLPMANRFDEVVGLDIAPAMLAEARTNAANLNIDNVEFHVSDDTLSNAQGKFDLVHTYIVLQHIPVAKGMGIIRHLLDRVAPGGVASLHFSILRTEGFAHRVAYWMRRHVPGVQPLTNFLRGRPAWEPLMQMNAYSVNAVLALFEEYGFTISISSLERHGRFLTMQLLSRREA